jgi:hypothetical protein
MSHLKPFGKFLKEDRFHHLKQTLKLHFLQENPQGNLGIIIMKHLKNLFLNIKLKLRNLAGVNVYKRQNQQRSALIL